jgi:hypothetical protein
MLLLLLAALTPDVGQAIQQAIDPCKATRPADGIVVCGESRQQRERYRLKREDKGFDPKGSVDSVSRERNRMIDAGGANTDLTRGSCSAVGASGATGCMIQSWRERREQKGW